MTLNWPYLYQQLLMLLLSGAFAAAGYGALRLLRWRARGRWWWICLELPVFALLLFAAGSKLGPHLGTGALRLLPAAMLPWTVGVAMAFYWMAVWWPLRALGCRAGVRHPVGRRVMLGLAAAMVLGAGYSVFVEPQLLEVDRRELVAAEIGEGEIRVAHVSDIQLVGLGPRERALVAAVNEFRPHLIVFSGDYIAGPHGEDVELAAIRWMLAELRSSHGMFATNSDSDDERQRALMFEGLPVRYLRNAAATVEVEGVRVRVGGLDHAAPRLEAMAAGAEPDELFVVACHTPDHAEAVGRSVPEADLYLCGHTHGGQVQVPFFGPLVTMCEAPRHVAAGGVFTTSTGLPLLLSRGVGMEGDYAPRFRFHCRPHVFLLTLRGSPTELRR